MFTVDVQGLDKINITLENYYKNIPKAAAHALNRTLAMVKTQQTKMAREKYQVKRAAVFKNNNIIKASSSNLEGKLISKGSGLGLDNFKLNPSRRLKNKKEVTVVVKNNIRKRIQGAFIAYNDGKLGVFVRKGSTNYPIKRLVGPSASQMLGEENILEYLQGYAQDKFKERLTHELSRLIK